MKQVCTLIFLLASTAIFIRCSDQHNKNVHANKDTSGVQPAATKSSGKLETGGLYVIKEKDNTYSVYKILVIDDFAVHVRAYSNTFQEKPAQINSAALDVLIGHSPIAKEGFLADNPELLKVEQVSDAELEGYEIYLKEMNKSN